MSKDLQNNEKNPLNGAERKKTTTSRAKFSKNESVCKNFQWGEVDDEELDDVVQSVKTPKKKRSKSESPVSSSKKVRGTKNSPSSYGQWEEGGVLNQTKAQKKSKANPDESETVSDDDLALPSYGRNLKEFEEELNERLALIDEEAKKPKPVSNASKTREKSPRNSNVSDKSSKRRSNASVISNASDNESSSSQPIKQSNDEENVAKTKSASDQPQNESVSRDSTEAARLRTEKERRSRILRLEKKRTQSDEAILAEQDRVFETVRRAIDKLARFGYPTRPLKKTVEYCNVSLTETLTRVVEAFLADHLEFVRYSPSRDSENKVSSNRKPEVEKPENAAKKPSNDQNEVSSSRDSESISFDFPANVLTADISLSAPIPAEDDSDILLQNCVSAVLADSRKNSSKIFFDWNEQEADSPSEKSDVPLLTETRSSEKSPKSSSDDSLESQAVPAPKAKNKKKPFSEKKPSVVSEQSVKKQADSRVSTAAKDRSSTTFDASSESNGVSSSSVLASFGTLKLSSLMLEALKAADYETPTPVQEGTIARAMAGVDLMGQAKTGTGKTAAFLIPIIEQVEDCEPGDDPVALIVVPTRELAVQVRDEAIKLSKNRDVITVACYGGKPIADQVNKIRGGVDIVVGTPGRILDLVKRSALSFKQLRWVVLDEADRMLDIGFRPDIERILKATPSSRQTLLFSATLDPSVVQLAKRYMKEPEQYDFSEKNISSETIEQYYITVDRVRKFDALLKLIEKEQPRQAIIFCRTKRSVSKIGKRLFDEIDEEGEVAAIHGDLSQNQRDHIMRDFRAGKTRYLVATDVVGRGIDITGISHIINYDIPAFCDDYVHRVGRTGRMGREGVAFTLVTDQEGAELTRIEKRINQLLKRAELQGFEAYSKPVDNGEGTGEKERMRTAKPVFGKPVLRVRRAL